MPARQIFAPVPVSPSRHPLKIDTANDLYAHLSSSLAGQASSQSTHVRLETPSQEGWSVPAPPPPSPVGFCVDSRAISC
ncbi:hypothetical protein GMORB2_2551 [Geosmithia morbida]|uniref:Uncharacterized protein n=1 Tax=Geosmithia morbida TaxID=1094350 RepID=A0A9P4YQT6_9HYPO|nr:uncharacterized protein GMORB2_2551 [Geosmithia morbida]KAF4121065.1 hypothetical protein GMORB2_2551 [Geosmithia morbida]